jgi:hypothetical protein
MAKIKNEEGEEIEVLTPEEVQAKLDAEKAALEEQHQTILSEKEKEVEKVAEEKKILEEKIAKLEEQGIKPDHPNFAALKSALDKKDEDIKAIKTELDADKKQRVQEELDTKIKLVAKGNEDIEKKIKHHLEKTLAALPENTAEERKIKLEAAFKLSSDSSSEGPGVFDMGTGGGGYSGGGGDNPDTVEFTAKEKALGAKLGITSEDYKKYSSRVSKKN